MELDVTRCILLILMGLFIGTVGGMIGVGGGVMIIPLLMFAFGFSQPRANGTSLAMMLPPIGIFAVMSYHRAGNIDWAAALIMAAGFAAGAYFGAKLVNSGKIHPTTLRLGFAFFLLYVAAQILFRPGGRARAALETCILVGGFAILYTSMRLLGRRWSKAPHWPSIYKRKVRDTVLFDYEI